MNINGGVSELLIRLLCFSGEWCGRFGWVDVGRVDVGRVEVGTVEVGQVEVGTGRGGDGERSISGSMWERVDVGIDPYRKGGGVFVKQSIGRFVTAPLHKGATRRGCCRGIRVDVGIDPYRNLSTSVFNKKVVLAPLFGARTDKSK